MDIGNEGHEGKGDNAWGKAPPYFNWKRNSEFGSQKPEGKLKIKIKRKN